MIDTFWIGGPLLTPVAGGFKKVGFMANPSLLNGKVRWHGVKSKFDQLRERINSTPKKEKSPVNLWFTRVEAYSGGLKCLKCRFCTCPECPR